MEYRYLGHSGLKISVLSLGGWVNFGRISPDVTLKCMQVAFENGINYFDTAEVYDGGKSEIDMGNAIKNLGWKRSNFVISTKIFWGGKGPNDRGLSRKHIIEGLNASLKRLELDYVDIVYAHRPDPDTPMAETVRAFNYVINQGKAFYWGTSEWAAHQIVEAYSVANQLLLIPPLVEQTQYNMFHRERVEHEYISLFKEFKMGAAVWSPLAGGILTGKHNEKIAEDSRLALQDNAPIADKIGMTSAQLAIAWCIKQPNVNTVITGASKPEQIEENIQAVKLACRLTPDVLKEIEDILNNKPSPQFNFRNC
ncbi:5640_t:CDS:2 [Racocetra persica]|uniref:5640_t:CDS:1 n=1 Tax=Racocetra persica TaxID=160502 RepID=A0ACA9KW58_9GLOM|nr:5640_t:CDS:2 [Racocetra persica]